ncbi:RES domain-containing protein [Paraburkholderia phenazinium]|jgi:hypothetical protein|uniref:RES domain-containing protein n=1 Tax=Paraburkholderia phenazinium TaxID=60549 RepID=A0A1G8ILT5_9BURK|nr:RES domain-containing protein [Paraburkholderia phenazinium]SDI19480.1 RES domain-containing protein [Paraburkholderia phenazinium]
MTEQNRIFEPPPHLRGTFPSVDSLIKCLSTDFAKPGESEQLFRAAYVRTNVVPRRITQAHRFGPPAALIGNDGALPFAWFYTAHAAETAMWEAQFCKNDVTRPGTYYLEPFAVENGVLAELRFARPLRLWNLNGSASSRLGIFDELSSPDHEWSQWFGYQLFLAMRAPAAATKPDGFVYPSRRHRGHTAVALLSDALDELRDGIEITEVAFLASPEYARARHDPLRVSPPLSSSKPSV